MVEHSASFSLCTCLVKVLHHRHHVHGRQNSPFPLTSFCHQTEGLMVFCNMNSLWFCGSELGYLGAARKPGYLEGSSLLIVSFFFHSVRKILGDVT